MPRQRPGPDEEIAAELERSAGRARARGGLAAAAAFLERAVALTVDPARRAGRTLAAAQASLGRRLRQGPGTGRRGRGRASGQVPGARADWLRGQIAFASGPDSDAPLLLLKAAKRLEPLSLDLARQTYVDAWQAAVFAGYLAGAGDLLEVSRAARRLSPARPPRPVDLLLDRLALMVTDGPAAAAPVLRQATSAFASADIPVEEGLKWGWLVRLADKALWDEGGWRMTVRQVPLAHDVGALDQLPILLNMMAMDAVWSGDFAAAAALTGEAAAVCDATGSRLAPYAAVMLASFRGREAEAAPLIQSISKAGRRGRARSRGDVCALGGRDPLQERPGPLRRGAGAAARQACEHKHPYVSAWTLPELIAAAAHTGDTRIAGDAINMLAERTRAGATEEGLGLEARCRALLSNGETAEGYHREAIGRLGPARLHPELARAHLQYGEWLRREHHRGEARDQLRTAYEMLDRDRYGGVCGARTARTDRSRGKRGQAHRQGHPRRCGVDLPGGPGRGARRERPVQPGDRDAAVHGSRDGSVPPEQGVRQAGHQLSRRAAPGAQRPGCPSVTGELRLPPVTAVVPTAGRPVSARPPPAGGRAPRTRGPSPSRARCPSRAPCGPTQASLGRRLAPTTQSELRSRPGVICSRMARAFRSGVTRVTFAKTSNLPITPAWQDRVPPPAGEVFEFDLYSSALTVSRPDATALFSEKLVAEPWRHPVRQAGVMGRFDVFANVTLVTPERNARAILEQITPGRDLSSDCVAGASRLPNEAGLVYKVLGMDTEPVKAKVRAFWALVRQQVAGAPIPAARPWGPPL